MTASWITLLLSAGLGFFIGAVYFGLLWWNTSKGLHSSRPALWFVLGFFVRLAIALAGFFYLMQFGWIAVISGLVGFTLARLLLIQKLKPDQGNSQRPTTEASALQNQYASAPEESDSAEGRGNAP